MEVNHRRDMWLPPDFISNDEFMFMHNRDNLTRTGFDNSFPASFPSSSASSFEFRSALQSVLASMEAEKERASLLTELTRRLSRSSLRENAQSIALAQRNLVTSWFVPGPQKPALEVAGVWCPGTALPRNPRPPCRPYQLPFPPSMAVRACHDPWYEIYATAEAAAVRRRMNGLDPLRTRGGVVSPTHRHLPAVNLGAGHCTCQCLSRNFPQPNHLVHARQEQATNSIWRKPTRDREPIISQQPPIMGERLVSGHLGLPEPACHRKIAAAGSGSEGKREIAGTGVFIPAPRSYGSTQPGTSQKKTGTMKKKVFIALLWIAFSTCLPRAAASVQSGPATHGEPPLLAQRRTHRPDILQHFKEYRGGWNVHNKHYWSSVAFTGAPAFILAVAWFFAFGAGLYVHYWRGWRPTIGEEGSDLAQRVCLGLIVFFTCLTVTGCVLVCVGHEELRGEALQTLGFFENQCSYSLETINNVTEYYLYAKTVNVAQFLLQQDVKDVIDKMTEDLKTKADTIEQAKRTYSRIAMRFLKPMRPTVFAFAALVFLFSLGCLVLSWRGKRYVVLIVFGWLLVTGTFVLLGGSVVLDSAIGDACLAIEELVDNAHTETTLSSILPCIDQGTTEKALNKTKCVINAVVNVVDQFIYQVADRNQTSQDGSYYYNQSGPLPPPLCYPYDAGLQERSCSPTEVSLADAPLVWKNFTCMQSASGRCNSPGRFLPLVYDQVVAAVNLSATIQLYAPRLASLADCEFARDSIRTATAKYCHPMRDYVRLMTASLALISGGILVYISIWFLYSNNPLT